MKTIRFVSLLICLLLTALVLCGCGSDKKGQAYIKAVVIDAADGCFTVECTESGLSAVAPGELISFEQSALISMDNLPDLSAGDCVQIVFNAKQLTKEAPPKMKTVYAVYLTDENGNAVDKDGNIISRQ